MSVNSYLKDLAQRAIVRNDERNGINVSIETIKSRLKSYFGNEIKEILIFGSYRRGTIISRNFDDNSDIDMMVVFDGNLKPQTYLDKLKNFANERYTRSEVYQSSPTIVLELNHIKFELVPAHKITMLNHHMYKIPAPASDYQDWIDTDPSDLDGTLTNNQTLRELVRVAKIWNAKQGYIYKSYELEKWITSNILNYSSDLKNHFYTFFNSLPIDSNLSSEKMKKIEKLQQVGRIVNIMDDENCIKSLFE